MNSKFPNPTTSRVSANVDMSAQEYKVVQQFLSQSCGIVLSDNKQYLVKNRLCSVLNKFELRTFAELIALLQSVSVTSTKVKAEVIDAMTTNETFWFRDDVQFAELKDKVLPEILREKKTMVRVWSAACSSGQEPYTISMCADEACKKVGMGRNVQVIGTDISEKVLKDAKMAVYSEMALSRGLDPRIRDQYFLKVNDGYKLKPEIMNRVRFQQFNLLKPFSVLGRFDIIFCRNVLIYFSDEVKRDILARMVNSLEPGGYLFLSSTESVPMEMTEFKAVRGSRARYFKKSS